MKKTGAQKKQTNYERYLQKQLKDPEYKKIREQELRRLRYAYKIAQLRKDEKLSQKEFAKKINTTQSVVSRIEHGSQNATISYLEKIADSLDRELVIDFKKKK